MACQLAATRLALNRLVWSGGSTPACFYFATCKDVLMTALWQTFSDDEREREYSPSSCVGGNIDPFISAYVDRSVEARAACEAAASNVIEVRYGPAPSHTIDLVVPLPSGELTPLLVFIHGGYWQALSKNESFFAAADCVSHGVAFAAVDYTLAPHVSLDEIVNECHEALRALRDGASSHGINPQQIIVCGSSAGGHLAAMVGLGSPDAWRPAAVGLVSGVYELEPLIGTSINDAVQLDLASAHRNSPLLHDLEGFPPSLLAHGDNETAEFKRQTNDMATMLRLAGVDITLIEVPDRNHFNVILDVCNGDTKLGAEMLRLIDRVVNDMGSDPIA